MRDEERRGRRGRSCGRGALHCNVTTMQYLGAAGGHQDHQDDGPGAVEVKQATATAEVPSSDEVS